MGRFNQSNRRSNDNETVYLTPEDVKEAAWHQFKDGEGNAHPMHLIEDDGDLYLVYKGPQSSGDYYRPDRVSAYDVAELIDFDSELAKDGYGKDRCLRAFEGVKDTVTIDGETYNIEVRYF